MTTLNIRELKPGMILAEPAESLQGVLLLKKGTEISEKDVSILKSWGVTRICVEGADKDGTISRLEAKREVKDAIHRELEKKFSGVSQDPVMREIMRVAGIQREKRYLRKAEANGRD
jgi:hypothetical protein